MQIIDILNEWAIFSEYDPNQTRFSFNSYWIHSENKKIEKLLKYDKSGVLPLLFAKGLCKRVLGEAKPSSYYALIEDPTPLNDCISMWNSFNHPVVRSAEEKLINNLNEIIDKVSEGKLIGDTARRASTEELVEIMSESINGIEKCTFDVFAKGTPHSETLSFNHYIHIFDTTEDCLRALNTAPSAIYLCYIRINDTAYGYFGFFVKDGENLYSLSERIDEMYPGQHQQSRNHREASNKLYNMFPYEAIFRFEEYDYKGYAGKHIINKENLALFGLGFKSFMPIMVAMYLINQYYTGKTPEEDISYIHGIALKTKSLQIGFSSETSLVPLQQGTALANIYENSILESYDKEAFLKGEYSKYFSKSDKDTYKDYGYFEHNKHYLVEWFGEDFDERYLDVNNLNDSRLLIGSGDNSEDEWLASMNNREIIGSEKRIKMVHYWWARKALANHIKTRMDKELEAFGGEKALRQWFEIQVQKNIENLNKMIVKAYSSDDESSKELRSRLIIKSEGTYPSGHASYIINKKHPEQWTYFCPIQQTTCNVFFTFKPEDWKEIALVLNIEESALPKALIGWSRHWNETSANPLLNIVDPVDLVSHALNQKGRFSVSVGYSKRGFAKLCKQNGIEPSRGNNK